MGRTNRLTSGERGDDSSSGSESKAQFGGRGTVGRSGTTGRGVTAGRAGQGGRSERSAAAGVGSGGKLMQGKAASKRLLAAFAEKIGGTRDAAPNEESEEKEDGPAGCKVAYKPAVHEIKQAVILEVGEVELLVVFKPLWVSVSVLDDFSPKLMRLVELLTQWPAKNGGVKEEQLAELPADP